MKKLFLFALLITIIGASSCKKDEVITPTPKTTSHLTMQAEFLGTPIPLQIVYFGLASSQQNLDNEIFITSIVTGTSGIADFGEINPGIYYLYCYHEPTTTTYYEIKRTIYLTANKDHTEYFYFQP